MICSLKQVKAITLLEVIPCQSQNNLQEHENSNFKHNIFIVLFNILFVKLLLINRLIFKIFGRYS